MEIFNILLAAFVALLADYQKPLYPTAALKNQPLLAADT
jgi:hypothetical protein